jgi:hypothetical protein
VDSNAAPLAVEQQLHARQSALQLADARDRADGVECFRGHALDVLPLGYGEDQTVGTGQRGLNGTQRGRTPSADRRGDTRKKDDLPQREDR